MIYLVAIFHATPGHADDLRKSLLTLIEPTRAEAGCILYDLHENTENPDEFLFYEIWESQAHLADHDKSAHLEAHRARSAQWTQSLRLIPMSKIA